MGVHEWLTSALLSFPGLFLWCLLPIWMVAVAMVLRVGWPMSEIQEGGDFPGINDGGTVLNCVLM